MILALKTNSDVSEFWLFENASSAKPAALLTWTSGRELSEQILDRLNNFLAQHGQDLSHLEGIVIFSGPGSFTSLRIGHSVANALADSLGIPVVGAKDPDWPEKALKGLDKAILGQPALPFYGAEAHITRPKS